MHRQHREQAVEQNPLRLYTLSQLFGLQGFEPAAAYLLLQGLDAVSKLESGDRIVAAKVVSGLDKLTAT